MATDIKKFLDQAGVSTLWSRVAEELVKKANVADVYNKSQVDEKIAAATYDDTALAARVGINETAIGVLNADSSVEGSVAYQIAAIVAGADASFDTLKEIADWIAAHPNEVATLNASIKANSDAIAALKLLVGDVAVATQISDAITSALKIDGIDKYALATDLSAALLNIATNTDDIATLKTTTAGHTTDIAQLRQDLNAIGEIGGEPNKIVSISVNGTAQSIDENRNVNIVVPVVQALTTEEIDTAITNAANQA